MFCKFKITIVSTRHRHNCTRSITCQNILGNPNRNCNAIEWINYISARKTSCNFFLCNSFTLTSTFYICNVGCYFRLMRTRHYIFNDCMLRCDHHKVNAKHGIRASCIYTQYFIAILHCKINLRTFAFSNPIGLHFLHGITKLNGF